MNTSKIRIVRGPRRAALALLVHAHAQGRRPSEILRDALEARQRTEKA